VDGASLAGLEAEWNALVETTTEEPFYRNETIRCFVENFFPARQCRTVVARNAGHRLVAGLPLVRHWHLRYGVPILQLSSPANMHSNRFDLVAEDAASAATAFVAYLAGRERWDVLTLTEVPDGGKAWHFYEAARNAGLLVSHGLSHRSPYITLPSSYERLQAGLRTKFLANLRRRRRRLEEKGKVTVERVAGAALQPAHFEECLALEQRGWKGRAGSALRQRGDVHGFYAHRAAVPFYRDHLSLMLLRLDDRLVAFHYGLTYRGTYSLLMTAYDEAVGECSPGHLLIDELLRDCVARGLREFDFLGCDLPWKLEWTATVRGHSWMYFFRNSPLGHLLQRAKLGWSPAARIA
jgi:CelD/BcsL family acetyltransferase involved in cellulose biosynthesis